MARLAARSSLFSLTILLTLACQLISNTGSGLVRITATPTRTAAASATPTPTPTGTLIVDATPSPPPTATNTLTYWAGTLNLTLFKDYLAELNNLPAQTCAGSWQVALLFSVDDGNRIDGTAHATLTSGPDCTFDIPGSASWAAFDVEGRASQAAFELRFSQTGIEPPGDWVGLQGAMESPFRAERVSATEARAEMSISATEAGRFPVTGGGSITLTCQSC